MIRFLFRLLATIALCIAVIMAVLDATRTIAAESLVTTSLATSWAGVSPDTLAASKMFVESRLHPLVWDPIVTGLLALPGFALFGVLAFLLFALGRRPQRLTGRFVT